MQEVDRKKLEEEVRDLCQRGEVGQAVERVLQGHGTEVQRVMSGILRDEVRVQDAYSIFCERLLKGLPGFRGEGQLWMWLYRMARNSCLQLLKSPAGREMPVSDSQFPDQAQQERSQTPPWQQAAMKERFRTLRESLQPQERMLLTLRLDQQLSWREVAQQMADSQGPLTEEALNRRATTLRQQFQRAKARLHALALEDSVLGRRKEACA
jgi:RNA polymerase sigma-70 factor, ECF subfamily